MTDKFRVQVLNHLSARGLRRLPWERFSVAADVADPHAILLRSADLHDRAIPESVLAVGRAGSGTNNIPVAALSARGVPVVPSRDGGAGAGAAVRRAAGRRLRWRSGRCSAADAGDRWATRG